LTPKEIENKEVTIMIAIDISQLHSHDFSSELNSLEQKQVFGGSSKSSTNVSYQLTIGDKTIERNFSRTTDSSGDGNVISNIAVLPDLSDLKSALSKLDLSDLF
jgi:hypothetical protein